MVETALWADQNCLYIIGSDQGRIQEINSIELSSDQDLVQAIANAPLGQNPGKVTIILDHPDLLLRPMVQPPADDERIDRMVRFEAGGLLNSDEPFGVDWKKLPVGSDEDLRLSTLTCRSRLLETLTASVKSNGGSLQQVIPPGIALYHAANSEPGGSLESEDDNDVIGLLHIGSDSTVVTLVNSEAPIITRTHEGGLNAMIKEIAEARGLDIETTSKMLAQVRGEPTAELKDAIDRQVAGLANLITQNLRMASGQMRLEGLKLSKILISGLSLPGTATILGDRARVPVRPINPWASRIILAKESSIDAAAMLPSPWSPGLGCVALANPFLDAMRPVQAARKAYWLSKGALRVAVAAAAALLILTVANLFLQQGRASDGLTRLNELVPVAENADRELAGKIRKVDTARLQLRFLHQSRAPARILNEFQNSLASLIDPGTLPVTIESLKMVTPKTNVVEIHLQGLASYAGSKPSSEVINQLKDSLPERYPPVTQIKEQTVALGKGDSQPFHWIITIPIHG